LLFNKNVLKTEICNATLKKTSVFYIFCRQIHKHTALHNTQ